MVDEAVLRGALVAALGADLENRLTTRLIPHSMKPLARLGDCHFQAVLDGRRAEVTLEAGSDAMPMIAGLAARLQGSITSATLRTE